MPIEFPCLECGSLLRTPDDSAGKKAKCPGCGAISEVPADRMGGAAQQAGGPAIQTGGPQGDPFQTAGSIPAAPLHAGNPFAGPAASPFAVNKPAGWENPYATPAPAADLYSPAAAARRELIPTRIEFRRTLQASWRIYADNLGILLLLVLMLIGLGMLVYLVLAGITVGIVFAVGQDAANLATLLIAIPVVLVLAIGALFLYSWLEAGLAIVALGLCRGGAVQFSDVFSGGRYTVQVFLLNLIRAIINIAIMVPFGLLGGLLAAAMRHEAYSLVGSVLGMLTHYFVILMLLLTTYFIVDRDLDVIQAMGASARFMRGNKLTVFATHIVLGICVILAVVLTCGIGILFVGPFFLLPFLLVLTATIYLLASGQPLARYAEPLVSTRT